MLTLVSIDRLYCRFFLNGLYQGRMLVSDPFLMAELNHLIGEGEVIERTGVAKLKESLSGSLSTVLYSDELIRLEYAIAQEILHVEPQDQRRLCPSEVKRIFMSIVACGREHKIPRILLDFTQNAIDMTEGEYKALMTQLAVGLMPTAIQKVARVATEDPAREQKVNSTYEEIQAAVDLALEFRNFTSRSEAIRWLRA